MIDAVTTAAAAGNKAPKSIHFACCTSMASNTLPRAGAVLRLILQSALRWHAAYNRCWLQSAALRYFLPATALYVLYIPQDTCVA